MACNCGSRSTALTSTPVVTEYILRATEGTFRFSTLDEAEAKRQELGNGIITRSN